MSISKQTIEEISKLKMNPLILDPHDKKSRPVLDVKGDMMIIEIDGYYMFKSLTTPHGYHTQGAYAIAHSQINDSDPLTFFVTRKEVIVNPRIINHTKVPLQKTEGCMTFPYTRNVAPTQRYHKITVEYQTIDENKQGGEMHLSPVKTKKLSGLEAQIWQHEIDHFNCNYIYQIA
jgi:peptide deformylase